MEKQGQVVHKTATERQTVKRHRDKILSRQTGNILHTQHIIVLSRHFIDTAFHRHDISETRHFIDTTFHRHTIS